ncbi:indole-3-glycerol phosphate synthase [Haladaptatus sp. NG-WS-4]
MNAEGELAPAVESILRAARERDTPGGHGARTERVSMDARSVRSLPDALVSAEENEQVPLVAEVKPTSPTTDGERTDDPVELARAMVAGGAAALSVLTEPAHFGGSPENLRRVRAAVNVPVLRKDFVLCEAQLDAVRADVVLLIARFVDDLDGLLAAARDRGFQTLVEVHTREELADAIDAGADIVGVNNRDLTNLDVTLATFESVAPAVPDDVTLIAESGITTPDDARRMREAGADGLLVGSAIMDGDVTENTRRLVEA